MDNFKQQVVLFLFYVSKGVGTRVLLINKLNPEWQRGLWNGVGGKLKFGEFHKNAVDRECFEETGIDVSKLEKTLVFNLKGINGESVSYFSCFIEKFEEPQQKTDETARWFWIDELPSNIMPNLPWLIPLVFCNSVKKPLNGTEIRNV